MTFACVVRVQKVEGLEPSKIIDALLSTVDVRGTQQRQYPQVIEDDVAATDTEDGQVEVCFRLSEGYPPTRQVVGAAVTATSVVNLLTERMVRIAPPLTHVAVTVE